MEIRRFIPADGDAVRRLLCEEGDDWACYHAPDAWERYYRALLGQFVLLAVEMDVVVGYVRAMDDSGFGVYIMDLLVARRARGGSIGRALIKGVRDAYPGDEVYVLSDADGYYSGQAFPRAGTIFEIPSPL